MHDYTSLSTPPRRSQPRKPLFTIALTSFIFYSVSTSPAWANPSSLILDNAPSTSREAPIGAKGANLVKLQNVQNGQLLFKTETPSHYLQAPTIDTDVKMHIAGPVIRTTLSQSFKNPMSDWLEGVYVFPLPENAAVDRLRIIVGGRLIEGQVKEKQHAKKIYNAAKAAGHKAGLVEQERPNMFTASVANIGPNETVVIQIEYQDKTRIRNGQASLIFPMTVAPRYSPAPQAVHVADSVGQSVMALLDPVLDRDRISPQLMPPRGEPENHLRLPVRISITLDAGFELSDINSAYHDITVSRLDADSAHITLKDGEIAANRDFKLSWRAAPHASSQKSVFKETIGQDTYFLTLLTPPTTLKPPLSEPAPKAHKRESLFIIDTSGSMGGTSIEHARSALLMGLETLEEGDSFNIIRFSNNFTSVFPTTQIASEQNLRQARKFIAGLKANGGTEMAPALDFALSTPKDAERLRQVIFMTDGSIGNEKHLFALIKDKLGEGRLFPVGIGSAPNHFFLSRAAKFGRGTSVTIGSPQDVEHEMGALFTALDTPVLTHINLSLSELGKSYPQRLPDLYKGEPIVSITKIANANIPKSVSLSGRRAEDRWSTHVDMTDAAPAKGLSVLWARRKIQDLEENRFHRDSAAKIDAQILKTALDHHLVSRLTSLVAVDITPARNSSKPLTRRDVPTMLPEGWDFSTLTGLDHAALARPQNGHTKSTTTPAQASAPQNIPLPGTASPHIFLIWLGGIIIALGRILFLQRPLLTNFYKRLIKAFGTIWRQNMRKI